jgi:chromosome segregation protein
MSRLRELRLHGFKSFADPTQFAFGAGINAVIGPNGSGKSNMADAVRWVLGEQSNRSLRTRRADDVIFAGSQHRRPQGMAEATLTLENADGWLPIDFAEVTIGRRAYRSGESEYLINGARARLRDVVELLGEGRLGANELVVVGQGTVDSALSLRPEERRQLFEEAAGVKNLQVRKNEALARLARARDNLSRVTDLISELKPQVRRLAVQAQHQEQHEALGRRARDLVHESHRRRERAERDQLGTARRRAAAAESELGALRAEGGAAREAIAAAEARYWAAEEAAREISREREATREASIRAEGRVDALRERHAELSSALAEVEREQAEIAQALARLAAPSGDGATEPVELAALRAAEAARDAAVGELAAEDATLLAAEEALAEWRRRQSAGIAAGARRNEELAAAQAREERLIAELAAAQAAQIEIGTTIEIAQARAAELDASLEEASRLLATSAERAETAGPRADEARQRASELAERVGALRAELEGLREHAEHGARLGARLAAAGWQGLLDAIDAPEPTWPAIEALIGGELEQALLWRDGDLVERMAGARGAARLVAISAGRPDDDGRPAALEAVRGTRTLAEWVGSAATPRLFARTVVADDVAALLDGWRHLPPGWWAVTPEGDLADGRGLVVLRGRGEPTGGASARQHARRRELAGALERLEAEHEAAQAIAARGHAEFAEAARGHDAERAAYDLAERRLRLARNELEDAQARLARGELEAAALATQLEGARRASVSLRESSAATMPADSRLAQLQSAAAAARATRQAAAEGRDGAREAWATAREAAERAEAGHSGRRNERSVLEARAAQLDGASRAQRDASGGATAELAAAAEALERARSADAAATSARADADADRDRLRAELMELERAAVGDARLAELEHAAQVAAIEASRHEDALAALGRERQLALDSLPETEVNPVAAPEELTAELRALDDEAIDTELRRVRRTLGQIGSVNPFAIEEHRELAARLDELAVQDADLASAIGSTEELIALLDQEIAGRFNAAFAAIGERFEAFCQLLFAGGSASLQMNDGNDGEEAKGIEIVVRPPGKRLQRLAMLSGGERALTGVALLFAMLSVNPVPFCILDEVDAALDEANVGRFALALRKLSETIDFVVITHNRATIEVADTIYGVTMTDAAVSRVLSLRLADLPVEVSA